MTTQTTLSDVDLHIQVDLQGSLSLPDTANSVVLFAHGSGSSRFSPRNRYVANVLNQVGIATLLFDLLTPEEEEVDVRTRELRFDIGMLAERLCGAVEWIGQHRETRHLPVGVFGASTGAAAALIAAAEKPDVIAAVVSRGGRPDLAGDFLVRVEAPTLMIVGGLDSQVIKLNRDAAARMDHTTPEISIVTGATHLFEEPGTLEQAAELARDWFLVNLAQKIIN